MDELKEIKSEPQNRSPEKSISIWKFFLVITRLPEDEPDEDPNAMHRTQKDHWIGWLLNYFGPGFYGRQNWKRDARFVYNHVVNPKLLIYLIRAIPLRPELVEAAENAYAQSGNTMMAQSGAIRKVVPWSEIYQALWGKEEERPSFSDRIRSFFGDRRKKLPQVMEEK